MRRLLSLWNNLSFQTKIGLAFTVLLLFSVPATVLSVNMIKDNRARAAGLVLGDTRYPDPVVTWTNNPNFRVEFCLNTTQRGGAYCNANNFPGSNYSYTYNSLNGYTYYWFVDMQDINGAWQQYQTGSYFNSCFNPGGTPQQVCGHTIGWAQPTMDTQAVYAGSALRNACDGFVSTCVSSEKDFYPNKQVQYVDLPPNINIDVYIKSGNILFLVLKNLSTGSVAVTSKPTLTIPTFGQQNVSTTNTNFAWTTVPGASYYALWVSTSNNFSDTGFWYKNVAANACTATDCLSSWTNGAWSIHNGNVGPYPPPPAALAKSTTYYWLAWACSPSNCPLPGLATPSNFTTESGIPPPSVQGLIDSDSQGTIPPGVWGGTHKFQWAGQNANSFVVDVSTDQNFVSNWAYKIVNVSLTSSLTAYSTTGTGGFINNGNVNWTQNGNLALQDGITYYWRVYASNSSSNLHSALPNPVVHKPPTTPIASIPSQPKIISDNDSLSLVPPGVWGSTHIFSWSGANATTFYVDVSADPTFNSGWVNKAINVSAVGLPQNYSTIGSGGWNARGNSYVVNGNLALQEGTTYYWRVFAQNNSGGLHSASPWPAITKPPTTSNPKPNPPNSLSPDYNGLACVPTGSNYGSNLTFRWNGSAQIFAVDVSIDRNFATYANKVVSGALSIYGSGGWANQKGATIADSSGNLSLKAAQVYFWRVWASNGGLNTNYDNLYNSGTPAFVVRDFCPSNATPILRNPAAGAINVSAQPLFTWTPASGADYYVIGVSDNQTNLLSFSNYWRSSIYKTDCSATTCLKSWTDVNWSSFRMPARPFSLTNGKTYYWFVWGCTNASSCTLEGLRTASFTVAGVLEQPPSGLTSTPVANKLTAGYYNFSWTQAVTGPAIDHYLLLLKENSSNLAARGYWQLTVSRDVCTGLPPSLQKCTTSLESSPWKWVPAADNVTNNNTPPVPLRGGPYFWTIVGCKTSACAPLDQISSDVKQINVPLGNASGTFLTNTVGQCKSNGKVDVDLNWAQSPLAQGQSVEAWNSADNTARLVLNVSVPAAAGGAAVYHWADLPSNTGFSWRVSTLVPPYFYSSVIKTFSTYNCSGAGQYPPAGFIGDGSYKDLYNYITAQAGDLTIPGTGNLKDTMLKIINRESNGGADCAYNVDYKGYRDANNVFILTPDANGNAQPIQSTIGAFQYTQSLWQSTAAATGITRNLNYIDSGSIRDSDGNKKTSGCWHTTGRDDISKDNAGNSLCPTVAQATAGVDKTCGNEYWGNMFHGNGYDADAWNPYYQIFVSAKFMLLPGKMSNWGM